MDEWVGGRTDGRMEDCVVCLDYTLTRPDLVVFVTFLLLLL